MLVRDRLRRSEYGAVEVIVSAEGRGLPLSGLTLKTEGRQLGYFGLSDERCLWGIVDYVVAVVRPGELRSRE